MEDDIKRALDKIHRNSYYGTYIDDKHKRLEEARETATQAPKIGSILDMSDDDFDAVAASRHQFAVGDFISTIMVEYIDYHIYRLMKSVIGLK